MSQQKMLFISMLGDDSTYYLDDYKSLCSSGLEKDWIVSWFGGLAQQYGFRLQGVDIIHGDTLPEPDHFDSVILGGTIHSVLEDRVWLRQIEAWLRRYRTLRRPLLGICGGHQMISARFFDSSWFVLRENGPMNGTYPIHLTPVGKTSPLLDGIGDQPEFHFANSYHIIPSPKADLKMLATMPDSPAVAVDYGGNWFGTQFHPESRKACWRCFVKGYPLANIDDYKPDHAGSQVMENFIRFSKEAGSGL